MTTAANQYGYWTTGNFGLGYRAPDQQAPISQARNAGRQGYGYQFYALANYGRDEWNKWAWSNSTLRTDLITINLWTPDELGSNLKGWYEGDRIGGATGTAVDTWLDDSGNGNSATTLGSSPDLVAADLNGLNTVLFTVANAERLLMGASGFMSGFTQGAVFFVLKVIGSPHSGLFSGSGTSGVEDLYPSVVDSHVRAEFLSTTQKDCGIPTGLTSWHIASFQSKASDWRYAINGTDFFTTATNTVGAPSGNVILGQNSNGAYMGTEIAEIVLCDSFLDTVQRQQVEGYLAWKWGLTAGLGAGHPYKTVPPRPAYYLTLTPGAYSLTGTTTGLGVGRKVAAAVGSYSITGTATALRIARKQVEAVGSYVITGTATGLKAARTLSLAVGSYAITGVAATFKVTMPAAVGSYTITGTSTALKADRKLAGAVGAYVLSGTATGLKAGFKLATTPGAYVLNGSDVTLTFHTATAGTVLATPGIYLLTGTPAVLRAGRMLHLTRGFYDLTGNDIDFIYGSLWNVEGRPGVAGWTPTPSIAAGLFTREPGPTQLEWSN